MEMHCVTCGDCWDVPDELIPDYFDFDLVYCNVCRPDIDDLEPDFTLDDLEWSELYE